MAAVTIAASWRICRHSAGHRVYAVYAGRDFRHRIFMASGARRGCKFFGVGNFFDVRVARHAIEAGMDGIFQVFRIDKQRACCARAVAHHQAGIRMAGEAIHRFLGMCRRSIEYANQKKKKNSKLG